MKQFSRVLRLYFSISRISYKKFKHITFHCLEQIPSMGSLFLKMNRFVFLFTLNLITNQTKKTIKTVQQNHYLINEISWKFAHLWIIFRVLSLCFSMISSPQQSNPNKLLHLVSQIKEFTCFKTSVYNNEIILILFAPIPDEVTTNIHIQ